MCYSHISLPAFPRYPQFFAPHFPLSTNKMFELFRFIVEFHKNNKYNNNEPRSS